MAKFAYNNVKNANIGHTFFELNCSYHLYISFKDNTNPYSQSKIDNKLSAKLQKLIIVCSKNLHYAQKL